MRLWPRLVAIAVLALLCACSGTQSAQRVPKVEFGKGAIGLERPSEGAIFGLEAEADAHVTVTGIKFHADPGLWAIYLGYCERGCVGSGRTDDESSLAITQRHLHGPFPLELSGPTDKNRVWRPLMVLLYITDLNAARRAPGGCLHLNSVDLKLSNGVTVNAKGSEGGYVAAVTLGDSAACF